MIWPWETLLLTTLSSSYEDQLCFHIFFCELKTSWFTASFNQLAYEKKKNPHQNELMYKQILT